MYSFENDYSEGACIKVLEALNKTNFNQAVGYGLDKYCKDAEKTIKKIIRHDDVDVHFITGGTPCNVLAISTLKAHEAVIGVKSAHINVHETGAVEATGHKIITVEGKDGKIRPFEIDKVISEHTDEHMVKPKMVFISNATEYGTVYSKEELKELYKTCKKDKLYLYLDGARLSNALVASKNLTLKDMADNTDIFYIGGTKNGALLGEAMIIKNDELKKDFRYLIKQKCAMLAKARIIGVQFDALMKDNLYLDNARHANKCAQEIKNRLKKKGIKMYIDSDTNQIFPILSNKTISKLKKKYIFITWGPYDKNHSIVRFVCSWATVPGKVEELCKDLEC